MEKNGDMFKKKVKLNQIEKLDKNNSMHNQKIYKNNNNSFYNYSIKITFVIIIIIIFFDIILEWKLYEEVILTLY